MERVWLQSKDSPIYINGHWYYAYGEEMHEVCAFDLTLMFGPGNEPRDVSDKRLAALHYEPYQG